MAGPPSAKDVVALTASASRPDREADTVVLMYLLKASIDPSPLNRIFVYEHERAWWTANHNLICILPVWASGEKPLERWPAHQFVRKRLNAPAWWDRKV